MAHQSSVPPKGGFVCLVRGCTRRKNLTEGKLVHALIVQAKFDADIFLSNLLIDMYSNCGSLVEALKVFAALPQRNVFSWTAMISAYVNGGQYKEALALFQQMQQSSIEPDKVICVVVLKACTNIAFLEQGQQLHTLITKRGFDSDVVVQTSLVDMYAKCGCLNDAQKLFNDMPQRNVVSWNAMIAGYAQKGLGKEALNLYEQMKCEGVEPDHVTLVLLLKACASNSALEQGKELHSLILEKGFEFEMTIQNTLIDMYAKCGCLKDAQKVFNSMHQRDVVSWSAMIAGYAQKGLGKEALDLYEQMKHEGVEANSITLVLLLKSCTSIAALEQGKELHSVILAKGFESEMAIQTTLIDMYAKCGCLNDAREVFHNMRQRDLVSWSAMIAGYAQKGFGKEALDIYEQMKREAVEPDPITLVLLLKACASISALERGKELHSLIKEKDFDSEITIQNTLIDMYAKCGCLKDARQLFNNMDQRDMVSWSAMIAGYAQEGLGMEALDLFVKMKQNGIKASEVTYTCVLSACSHCGLVDEGRHVFENMFKDDGVTPTLEHYACMVDLLGRSGLLADAENFIMKMPIQPHEVVWMSLLGAARKYVNVEIGRRAFERVVQLQTEENAAPYLLLEDIYLAGGRMIEVAQLRQEMKRKGVKKVRGCSWIEDDQHVHSFILGDSSHPYSKQIYAEVERLNGEMEEAGHTPDLSSLLSEIEGEKVREAELYKQSERLDITFGLKSMPPGIPLHVKKTLRLCRDCHNAIKFISKVVGHNLIMDNTNRVHHFKDQCLSCANYLLSELAFVSSSKACSVPTSLSNYVKIQKLCDEGRLKEALLLLEITSHQSSITPVSAFACLLRGCTSRKALAEGKVVHAKIVEAKCDKNIFLSNLLIELYSNCGSLVEALDVFATMPQRNVFSWTAMISAYVNVGQYKEALTLYQQMQQAGIELDKVICIVLLKACASVPCLEEGQQLHTLITKRTFNSDITVQNGLIDMYAKCGCLKDARELFDNMAQRDVVSWNAMIAGYAHKGLGKQALDLYDQMTLEGVEPDYITVVLLLKACANISALERGKELHSFILEKGFMSETMIQNTLIDMYAKCGCLKDARELFNNMHQRNVVSWSTMIAGYAQKGLGNEALDLYEQMKHEGVEPNNITLVLLLKACVSISALERGKELHSLILEKGLESDMTIQTTLIDMYAKCGCLKCACEVFNNMHQRDLVSWSAMIAVYAQKGLGKEALDLYEQMKRESVEPDHITFVLLLKACASISALERGKELHSLMKEKGFDSQMSIQNTLIDMYAKCGCLRDAQALFDNMQQRDVISWSAMIAGYAQEGLGKEALDLYEQMKHEGLQANKVTYTSVLSACSHSGLVDEGRHIFESMFKDSGVTPSLEHYTCMADILGRAGFLSDAEDFVLKMPIQPHEVVWMSILAAARKHVNVEIGRRAFEHVVQLQPAENIAPYLLLIDIYVAAGRMDEVAQLQKEIKHKGLDAVLRCSPIEVDNQMHSSSK